MNHQFSVIIDKTPEGNEEILAIADSLGDAGCLDSSIGGHQEGIEAMFNREAESLDAAIRSAVSAIEELAYESNVSKSPETRLRWKHNDLVFAPGMRLYRSVRPVATVIACFRVKVARPGSRLNEKDREDEGLRQFPKQLPYGSRRLAA